MTATIIDLPRSNMETRYIPVTETAKIIRKALKEAFPEIKFSVRTSKYAGGSSIDVEWTDGPAADLVEPIAKAFQGGYFDGMTDYKGGHTHEFNGERVHFGGDFVFCHRRISEEKMAAVVAKLEGLNEDDLQQIAFRFDVWHNYNPKYDGARELAHRIAYACSQPGFEGRKSPTAESARIIRSY